MPANTAKVTCSCPVCGAMALPKEALELVVCASAPDRSFYQFVCPRCDELVTKPANPKAVDSLSICGVRVSSFPLEALQEMGGPQITMDDVLDFGIAMSDTATFSASLAALKDGVAPS